MHLKIKHWDDTRTGHQIDLSNRLVEVASDFNLFLHSNKEYPCTHSNKDILTITVNGVPPNRQEWRGFTFTKKVVNYFPPCLQLDQTPEFYEKRIRDANMETVLREVDEIVRANGNQVIFASHSFGSYVVTAYAHYFPEKVKGIIEFGCVPITVYYALKQFGKNYIFGEGNLDPNHLIQNSDKIHGEYLAWVKQTGIVSFNMMNKYSLLAFYMIVNAKIASEIFEWRRQSPKILKLITFGRRDQLFQVFLLNDMACHFTYGGGALQNSYNTQMSKEYTALTGYQTENVQQRFIYSYPKAGHGLHIKRKKPLQNLINLYLALMLKNIPESASL